MRTIDADALKEELEHLKYITPSHLHNLLNSEINRSIEAIDNAPTVEPSAYVGYERLKARQRGYEDGYHTGMEIGKTLNPRIKQGKWIIVDDTEKFIAKCSVCGRIEDSRMIEDYPFCHCGADMKGGDKNG